MGWRDTFKEEDDKKLPEMTTIFDAKTQSVQLILWSDYVGKGYQAFDLSQRARLRRTQIKRSVAKDELLPEEVEGCDIAHPFRDFMAESLRETNEKVKFEMEKTINILKAEMEKIKKSQEETEKENQALKTKLADSENHILSLKEDMDQVQRATWENRNFRIEMKEKMESMETHLEKTVGFVATETVKKTKKAPIPDYTVVYNPRTKQAELMLLNEYLNSPANPRPQQQWAMIYDEEKQATKLIFWRDYIRNHEPKFLRHRRQLQVQDLERTFDKELAYAPLNIRNKVAMIKFWLKTIELPLEDNFSQAYQRAKTLFEQGNQIGVEVPKALYEILLECDMELVWTHQTPEVHFEGPYSFLKEIKMRLQSEDKNFPKLPIRKYKKDEIDAEAKKASKEAKEKGQIDQKIGEKKPIQKKKPPVQRKLWSESSYHSSEAAGQDVDPFTSMFLLS